MYILNSLFSWAQVPRAAGLAHPHAVKFPQKTRPKSAVRVVQMDVEEDEEEAPHNTRVVRIVSVLGRLGVGVLVQMEGEGEAPHSTQTVRIVNAFGVWTREAGGKEAGGREPVFAEGSDTTCFPVNHFRRRGVGLVFSEVMRYE